MRAKIKDYFFERNAGMVLELIGIGGLAYDVTHTFIMGNSDIGSLIAGTIRAVSYVFGRNIRDDAVKEEALQLFRQEQHRKEESKGDC